MPNGNIVRFTPPAKSSPTEIAHHDSHEPPPPPRRFEVADQLKEASFRIDDVIESLSDGFALYDPDDRLVLWNTKFANILHHAKDVMYPGIPFETLVRKCAKEHVASGLISEAQREAWLEDARKFQYQGTTYERLTPDGKCYIVSRRKSSAGFTAVVWTDITDRKRSQDSLAESEQLYRALFENSAQGILVVTRTRIAKVNDRFSKLFGINSPHTLRSVKHIDELLSPDDRPKFKNIRRLHFSNKNIASTYELEGSTKDGKHIWLQVTVTNIKWHKEPALQITFLDISERKQFLEDLIAMKLESVGTMARGFAMEFQKIQSAIMSQVRLAKMEAYATGNESIFDAMTEAEQFGAHLDQLTDQLLFLYRSGVPFKESVPVEELVKMSLPNSGNGFKNIIPMNKKKTDITIHLDRRLPSVRVDKRQVVQVLQALIENGLKAMPFGGVLKLAAEAVQVLEKTTKTPVSPGLYVKLSIIDQGEGLPAESVSRIFDPYFASRQMTVGSALATAFSIVRNHRGTITVSSKLGKGTRMTVFLPAEKER